MKELLLEAHELSQYINCNEMETIDEFLNMTSQAYKVPIRDNLESIVLATGVKYGVPMEVRVNEDGSRSNTYSVVFVSWVLSKLNETTYKDLIEY